jgi:hypothetical protein
VAQLIGLIAPTTRRPAPVGSSPDGANLAHNFMQNWAVRIYAVAVLVGVISFPPGSRGGPETVRAVLLASHAYVLGDAL